MRLPCPCFRSARATCPTRPMVRVPMKLGLRRSLGCRPRCRVSPATRLPPRGLTVPWLSLRRTAHPPAGYAEPHCRAYEHLWSRDLVPTDYSLPSRLAVSYGVHGCYTALSPRGLTYAPFGNDVAYRQLLPLRLRSLPPYPLFLAESEGRPDVPVARLSLLGWSAPHPFGMRFSAMALETAIPPF